MRPGHVTAAAASDSINYTVIEPSRGWSALNLGDLWRFRDLIYVLAWRDVKVRYKQTVLGVLWALLQPLLAMVVFTIFLGVLVKVPSDGVPYPLFAYLGLLPWTYFANAVANASTSLVGNSNLVTKVYFPRLVMPLAGVLSGVIDLAISCALLIVPMVAFGYPPGPTVLLAPLFVIEAVLMALGVSTWLSALDVQYRDVRYAAPFLIQVWMFATPLVYPASLVPESYRVLYGLNPMAGVVEGFRWAVLGHTPPAVGLLALSWVVVALVLGSGLVYFRQVERRFADTI